jgi:hypothetical protein
MVGTGMTTTRMLVGAMAIALATGCSEGAVVPGGEGWYIVGPA